MARAEFANMPQPLKDAFLRVNPDERALRRCTTRTPRGCGASATAGRRGRSVRAPTLIVVGDRDIVGPEHAAELARLIPEARLLVLPGGTRGLSRRGGGGAGGHPADGAHRAAHRAFWATRGDEPPLGGEDATGRIRRVARGGIATLRDARRRACRHKPWRDDQRHAAERQGRRDRWAGGALGSRVARTFARRHAQHDRRSAFARTRSPRRGGDQRVHRNPVTLVTPTVRYLALSLSHGQQRAMGGERS